MSYIRAPQADVVDASVSVDVVTVKGDWPARMEAWAAEDAMLFAPPHFVLETANGMLRGQRLPIREVRSHLRHLAGLEISSMPLSTDDVLECVDLAERHGLTTYDAAYLQLALHLDAELATQDKALARAARAEGLVVHD
jgi:predicted nucleic acid-binding protein